MRVSRRKPNATCHRDAPAGPLSFQESQDFAHLIQPKARIRRGHFRRIALAEIAQEVRLPLLPGKNSASTLALSKPDIGPQSSPSARAASMKYAACRLALRNAVDSRSSGVATYQCLAPGT